ncbi:unnamed protein product [Cladocopium goreaui]|uniref:Uncharacterized protein n=1 Tax=Cladocopium goreaui TaxID=2562237 RepID=A0A9P1D293_9DINO|nr:unnamed protein product [Cladocopium goreaui]
MLGSTGKALEISASEPRTQAVTLSQKGEKKSSGTFSDQFHRCKGPWPTRRLRLLDLLTLSARKRRCGI